jgi:acyl-CoA dehydrogenase
MRYDYSPEQLAWRDEVRTFVREHVSEALRAEMRQAGNEGDGPLARAFHDALFKKGWWGVAWPKEFGGLGKNAIEQFIFIEEMEAAGAPGMRLSVTSVAPTIFRVGTKAQQDAWLPRILAGEIEFAVAYSEPDAGTDMAALTTRAELDGDEWVINGHKWFTSGAMGASFAIVMAKTERGAPTPHDRFSMIIVPLPNAAVSIRPVRTMGHTLLGGGHCEVRYESCRVPKQNLLGDRGAGFKIAQSRLGPGRIQHCMRWLGVAGRAMDLMCRYVVNREAFGGPLGEKQTVQNWIADSKAEMDAARLMTLHAAWKMEQKLDYRVEVSLIKFFGAKVLHDVIDRAIQAHGAMGFSAETPLEMFYREARAARIYDGPDEVHRMVVARRILRQYR